MIKKLNVPYYSQYRDVKDTEWKSRSCAIVGVKMILDYYKNQNIDCDSPEIEELIEEGVFLKALNENKDWIHDKLVVILRNHGVSAYRQEFRSVTVDLIKKISVEAKYSEKVLSHGINKLVGVLENKNPVLVSVVRKFKEDGSFHMVVLTGFEKDEEGNLKGFYYNDSDYLKEEDDIETGEGLFVSIKDFRKYWRRMAIFSEDKN